MINCMLQRRDCIACRKRLLKSFTIPHPLP
jgi:hypothetical protein